MLAILATAACSSSDDTQAAADTGTPTDTAVTDSATDTGVAIDSATDMGGEVVCDKLPSTGPTTVIPPRTDGSENGARAALAIDRKGAPLFAYLDKPESGDSKLYVVRWDRCTGAWLAPVKVDDAINNDVSARGSVLSISVDPSDGRIGVAFRKVVHLVTPPRANDTVATYVALSTDDGATFTSARVSKHKAETSSGTEGDADNIADPTIVLGGGKTYVAYNQNQSGCGATACWASTVLATGTAGTYTYASVIDGVDSAHGGTANTRTFPLGLALDSDGAPGLVVHIEPPTAYNTKLLYWQPGKTGVVVYDSQNHQNDDGAAALAYDGKKPRIVSRIQRGPIGTVTEYDLSASSSADGVTWTAPVALPRKGDGASPSEQIAVAGGKVYVGAGGPRLFTSSDLTTWTVDDLGIAQGSASVSLRIAGDGKVWMGIEGTADASTAVGGIVLYRQP